MKTVGFSHVGAGTLLLYSMVVAICTIAGPRVSYAADAERALRHQSNGNAPSATTGLAVRPTGSVEPSVSCLANPSQIAEGGTVEILTEASSPERLPLTYSWSASAGTIYGGDEDKATLFTTDVAPGTVTVTCRVADDQGGTASATTVVTVSAPGSTAPPAISCSATPSTVALGGSVAITATASSPEGRPLTYSWSASSGTISGSGNTATLNTTGAASGTITVTCKVADDQGRSASAITAVAVSAAVSTPPTISCSATPSTVTLGAV